MVAAYESSVSYSVKVGCDQNDVDTIFFWAEEKFPDLTVVGGDPFARVGELFIHRPYESFSDVSDLGTVSVEKSALILTPVVDAVKTQFPGAEVSGPDWHTYVEYL